MRAPRIQLAPLLAATLLVACYVVASAQRIDLFFGGDDLGRHLKNGELLISPSAPPGVVSGILHTNFYSYAAQDTEFINHHWLSGVVFYLVFQRVGFAGLNAFYILLGVLTFLLSWRIAQKAAGWPAATAIALPMMPILAVRPNVRPEIFTLLFCAIFLTLLWKHYNGEIGWRALLALPAMEILWVNLHIGFVFGLVFIGAFMLGDLAARPPAEEDASKFYFEKFQNLKRWTAILLLSSGVTLLNPNGIRGAVYPFTIWSNYGIDIAENHSIVFLESTGYTGEFTAVKLTLLVLYVSFLVAILRAPRFPVPILLLGVTLGAMAFFAIRHQTVMAMFALPAIGINLGLCGLRQLFDRRRVLSGVALGALILAALSFDVWKLRRRQVIGLGLADGSSAAADFLRSTSLPGPILNNLNVGAYLIFHFHPRYRVYTDSRPEAYRASFLQTRYIQPLTGEDKWKALLQEYQFNLIFFSYASKWEQDFLARRIQDPDWAVVYSQAPVVILLRRTPERRDFILQHEIPKERVLRFPPKEKAKP
jgi:hypothetical protein